MKNFYLTIWSVLLLFLLVIGGVVTVAFIRPSNATGIDPAQICQLRRLER